MGRIIAHEPARDPALSHPECSIQFSHCCEIYDGHEDDLDMLLVPVLWRLESNDIPTQFKDDLRARGKCGAPERHQQPSYIQVYDTYVWILWARHPDFHLLWESVSWLKTQTDTYTA